MYIYIYRYIDIIGMGEIEIECGFPGQVMRILLCSKYPKRFYSNSFETAKQSVLSSFHDFRDCARLLRFEVIYNLD